MTETNDLVLFDHDRYRIVDNIKVCKERGYNHFPSNVLTFCCETDPQHMVANLGNTIPRFNLLNPIVALCLPHISNSDFCNMNYRLWACARNLHGLSGSPELKQAILDDLALVCFELCDK